MMEKLLNRGVAQVLPSKEGLAALMQKRKIRLYLGIDPTGGKLHLGHSIPLRKLQQFADLGHEAILVVGTGTVLAGDPSQRESARSRITEREIAENIKTWKRQAGKIVDFSKVKIRQNGDWLKKLRLPDILSIASRVSAVHLLQRDMFQKRIERGDTVWTHEMLYPLLQGYDSVALDVDLEIGGTDQVFNMLVGRELQKKMKNKEKYVLCCPMILGLDGRTMSKTSGNTVNIEDEPADMYGKLMSLNDNLIPQYFELCTDASPEILAPRDLKAQLAREIVRMYHGEKKAQEAEQEFNQVFRNKELPSEIREVRIDESSMQLSDLLVQCQLASSKGEAKRL
ncbi:MAG: tyrosine--tRNA ligase, partial [bacterium]|nr:tyrosine--tRNA ligase [bacterium]